MRYKITAICLVEARTINLFTVEFTNYSKWRYNIRRFSVFIHNL